jgi:hypothetical protein
LALRDDKEKEEKEEKKIWNIFCTKKPFMQNMKRFPFNIRKLLNRQHRNDCIRFSPLPSPFLPSTIIFESCPGGVAQWTSHPSQEREDPGSNTARV